MKLIVVIAVAAVLFTGFGIVKTTQGLKKTQNIIVEYAVDYSCLSDCLSRYTYGYCKALCSY